MPIAFIFSLLFSVLVVIFALQNSASVTINFLFVEHTISQALVILISAIFGAIIVLLLSMLKQFKSDMKIRTLTKTINKLEEDARLVKENEEMVHRESLEEENRILKENEEIVQSEILAEEDRLLEEARLLKEKE
ncbi:lipopolysaccharide assembly protein LapA domain-containing protein [Bacillaceae bacterium IKA-2]|nr:lipopolysaccharide assembly protein LapA domain-containing protein [Bacillaceae bacterium IKA-2]